MVLLLLKLYIIIDFVAHCRVAHVVGLVNVRVHVVSVGEVFIITGVRPFTFGQCSRILTIQTRACLGVC